MLAKQAYDEKNHFFSTALTSSYIWLLGVLGKSLKERKYFAAISSKYTNIHYFISTIQSSKSTTDLWFMSMVSGLNWTKKSIIFDSVLRFGFGYPKLSNMCTKHNYMNYMSVILKGSSSWVGCYHKRVFATRLFPYSIAINFKQNCNLR